MSLPRLLLLGLVLTLTRVHAAPLQPGEYVAEGGWARLVVAAEGAAGLPFTLFSTGPNGHSCDLAGDIAHGSSRLEVKGMPVCLVKFTAGPGRIDVAAETQEACRVYCGARAGFAAAYLRVADECRQAAREATRKAFKQLYDSKAYAEALARLQPLLTTCADAMDELETGWLRNDIAVTQHKLRQFAACRASLAPLAKDAGRTDEAIREDLLPVDALNVLPLMRATRTNLRLCQAGR